MLPELSRTFTAEQRETLAKKGHALPDGSFPIVTEQDLRNAIQAFGRAKNQARAKRHIIKRARALGKTSLLPESWRESGGIMNEPFEVTRERIRSYYGRNALLPERSLVMSANDTRELLRNALVQEHADRSVWVRDFHDGWVVYEIEWQIGDTWHQELWRVSYTIGNDRTVELGDDPVQVEEVRQTTFQPVRAFLTEINGKTLLTGPADAWAEKAATGHPHVLWMKGRFVGAEQANRNGALWTTADLEMGEPTVKHGPLNWLHEERHIIGAIVDSSLVRPTSVEQAGVGDVLEPYIAASSAVWKWIWPQESAVIEQASKSKMLWYSMECISENVHCGECSGVYPYMDTVKAAESVCEHIKERSSTRRFENPTFLGGGVIVPPVRPGWTDAHAELMVEAAQYAEKAWDQTGLRDGDMSSSQFEELMAQVVSFARV